jgi:hypothetical protein
MLTRREPVVVYAIIALSFSAVFAGLLVFPSPPSTPAMFAECSEPPSSFVPPSYLTPANPVLLPKCAQYSFYPPSIVFSIDAPVDLRGSWVASAPMWLGVYNATVATGRYGCPNPGGCLALNGSLNLTLFPGTYAIAFSSPGGETARPVLTVTQAFRADFDRGLSVLQLPGTSTLSAENFSSWRLSVPAGASSFWLDGSITTTGCSFILSILPPLVYQAFQSNRSEAYSPDALVVSSGWSASCPSPPVSRDVGPGPTGPLNLTSGDILVFLNSWGSTAQVTFLAPIELSYLMAA